MVSPLFDVRFADFAGTIRASARAPWAWSFCTSQQLPADTSRHLAAPMGGGTCRSLWRALDAFQWKPDVTQQNDDNPVEIVGKWPNSSNSCWERFRKTPLEAIHCFQDWYLGGSVAELEIARCCAGRVHIEAMDLVGLELRWKCLARIWHSCVRMWGIVRVWSVVPRAWRQGIANAVNEELESLAVQSQAWTCNRRICPKCWFFWWNKTIIRRPLNFGVYPFLDNSRMPLPTADMENRWTLLASLAGLFASWLQWFKVPCRCAESAAGVWWDPAAGAHYVPLVCRPGTDSWCNPQRCWVMLSRVECLRSIFLTYRLPSCIKTVNANRRTNVIAS